MCDSYRYANRYIFKQIYKYPLHMSSPRERLNIALVSDFFYPSKGGVETHMRTIGEELVARGHVVVVITHKYSTSSEIFNGKMSIGNLIVYYLDIPIIAENATLPTMFTNYVLFGEIFRKHNIHIVHGHQSMSGMCLEAIYHANVLNIKTVMTDHSLFEIAKFERVLVNGLTRFICKNLDHAVCVSQISRENTHIRTEIPLEKISVIPNGIIPEKFYPVSRERRKTKRILFMSRLTFRKGADILIDALSLICKGKDIEVFIVGSGPKEAEVRQAIDENDLHDQVHLLGEIIYEAVPDFLRSGDIFLSTSLTETFCIAILEAAACGLLVVSTNVGGVHEVLGNKGIIFCEPTAVDVALQVHKAVEIFDQYDPFKLHEYISNNYRWAEIARQIEDVYYKIPDKKLCLESVLDKFRGPMGFLSRFGMFVAFFQAYLFEKIL